ncbi:MAG: hypothetical protein HY259_15570 [Chloroflexi bacterium]|nr:hypothetical protein [Chloroflexota bacterium]MBI3734857.1 hypothetical protein [Chloroflexota bacterium]
MNEALMPFGDDVPFDLDPNELMTFAMSQYAARMTAIRRALDDQKR